MLVLYTLTLFVSATLLFLVQPMVGKIILPLLGGTPAVWNTCMVFFQAVLLAGYAFAHASTSWLGVRRQAVLQLVLLPLPLLVLPIAIDRSAAPTGDTSPVLAVLLLLSVHVGLPFFMLSTSAPVLQKWFADTNHPSARDPYFLYAASNLGSMLALLAYPALIEPNFVLGKSAVFAVSQTHLWTVGYGVLVLLYVCCAVLLWRSPPGTVSATAEEPASAGEPVTARRRLRWVMLAFIPSSLMIGATTYLTTDVAAIPLLWVLPLAIYLLSFIFVFGRMPAWIHRLLVRVQPFVLLVLLLYVLSEAQLGFWVALLLHLGGLFLVSMVCHGELARDRPATRDLTSFYLLMSLGGVLGGAFNGLLAPVLFPTLMEYPLVLLLACLLLPREDRTEQPTRAVWRVAVPAVLCVFCLLLFTKLSLAPLVAVGLALLVCLVVYLVRPVHFGLSVGAVVLAAQVALLSQDETKFQERSFFAIHKVRRVEIDDPRAGGPQPLHILQHGTTRHGVQWLSPDEKRRGEPLSYFHRTGPMGQLFAAFDDTNKDWTIGVAGLGAGTFAAYGKKGQRIVFYEIDDLVRRIAFDPQYFNYVGDAKQRGVQIDFVLGDARLTLEQSQEQFDLLILDAFSSDSLPLHLITEEALRMYLTRVKEHGLLVFNISNRYVDLEPVLGNLAKRGDLGVASGLTAIVQHDRDLSAPGKTASSWVVMTRSARNLGKLGEALGGEKGWRLIKENDRVGVWTDNYSNLLRVFYW